MKNEILHQRKEFTDMRNLVEETGAMYSDRYAYSFRRKASQKEATKITFAQLRDDVRGLTTEFISRGYSGKHCAIIGKNSYEWYLCYFSLLSAGAVIVPLDREWLAPDLADTVSRAGCEVILCDADIKEKVDTIVEKCGIATTIWLEPAGEESVAELAECGKAKFAESSDAYFNNEIDPDKMSIMVFTSGTTGKGKGVMLTQRNVLSDMADVIPYMDFGIKTVGVLPPHHTFGSSVMIVGHASIGAEIYISGGLRYVQKELKEEKPQHLVLVPLYLETFYRKILANIKAQNKEKLFARMVKLSNALRKIGIDLRKKLFKSVRESFGGELKMVVSGGAPLNSEMVDFFEAVGISTLNN